MKRISITLFLLITIVFAVENSFAQSSGFYSNSYANRNSGSFQKNISLISAGIGMVNTNGINGNALLGPFYAKYEYGILDEIGIGAFGGLSIVSRNRDHYTLTRTAIGFGLMGYYHFNKLIPVSQLDVYAGAGPGFKVRYDNYSRYYDSYANTNLIFAAQVGARWYFTREFAAFAEMGHNGMSHLTLGVTLKL